MVRGRGIKEQIKRTGGQGQQCRDWVKVEEGTRGINGNGKNTIKMNELKDD